MTASFRKRWHLGSRQETLHRVRCALSRFECKLSETHRTASTSTWGRWYSHHLTRAFSVSVLTSTPPVLFMSSTIQSIHLRFGFSSCSCLSAKMLFCISPPPYRLVFLPFYRGLCSYLHIPIRASSSLSF